jgi:predicted AlkP superfamily phosphohydrolase/phosphomutase
VAKVLFIGIDSAVPSLVKKYFNLGILLNMKKLANEGTWSEIMPVFPTASPSNWTSISTGTWPKTHGVTDMVIHMPGTPLTEIKSGFYSDLCHAEQIWKTAERFGKKVILLKFMCSWPPTIKRGIQIEGFGAPGGPGSRPWGSSPLAVSNSSCYSTVALHNATVISFSKANLSRWKNTLPRSLLPPLETQIKIGPGEGVSFWILALASSSENEYDTVLISKYKDFESNGSIILKKGEVSKWLFDDFRIEGKTVRASFRMKLINTGSNEKLEDFRLYVSQIFPIDGWTFPQSVAAELVNHCGPFLESISHFPYAFGWIDESTYLDDIAYQADWLSKVTEYLMSKNNWNLYMAHWHGIDNTQHAFLRFDKSILTEGQSKISDNVVSMSYKIADRMVGQMVNSAHRFANKSKSSSNNNNHQFSGTKSSEDNDDDVYTFVISDHGQVMGTRRFFINQHLYEQGLIKLKRDSQTRKIAIDWKNTQAFAQGMVSIYVNLEGREPEGAVSPGEEYNRLVDKLIDMLYDIRDPKTGGRIISLALRNNECEFLGLSGERIGDVIFACNPVYVLDNRVKVSGDLFEDLKTGLPGGSIHGQQLPSVDLGKNGTVRSMFLAHGPKIKKGYIREKPINMIDIAPTVAHILGIAAPRNSEGKVLFDILE